MYHTYICCYRQSSGNGDITEAFDGTVYVMGDRDPSCITWLCFNYGVFIQTGLNLSYLLGQERDLQFRYCIVKKIPGLM